MACGCCRRWRSGVAGLSRSRRRRWRLVTGSRNRTGPGLPATTFACSLPTVDQHGLEATLSPLNPGRRSCTSLTRTGTPSTRSTNAGADPRPPAGAGVEGNCHNRRSPDQFASHAHHVRKPGLKAVRQRNAPQPRRLVRSVQHDVSRHFRGSTLRPPSPGGPLDRSDRAQRGTDGLRVPWKSTAGQRPLLEPELMPGLAGYMQQFPGVIGAVVADRWPNATGIEN